MANRGLRAVAVVAILGLVAGGVVALEYRPGPSYDPVYTVDAERVPESVAENTTVVAYEDLSTAEREEFDAARGDGGAEFDAAPELVDFDRVIAYDGRYYRVYVSVP